MDENNATDLMSMTIIANSGDARSFAFQALESVKAGKLEEAEELLKKANELIKEIILLYKNR